MGRDTIRQIERVIIMRFLVTMEQDEAGYWVVECPALPGCLSQGRTREEALGNVQEAILLSLETRKGFR